MRPRRAICPRACGCIRRRTTVSGSEFRVASAGGVWCDVKLGVTTRNFELVQE